MRIPTSAKTASPVPAVNPQQMISAYSDSYEAARTKFRGRCDGLNWLHSAHATEHPGLTIDVASSPNPGAKTLIITSGLHGIEGFFGSAVQCELMAQLASGALAIPAGCALVLVHALNPFGFANLRRTDAANVDLNRNFLLPQQSFTGAHKDYHLLHPLLNPQHQPRGFDLFLVHMLLKSWRMGRRHIKDAVASGQYEYPTGLFYGGSAPSPTSRLLNDLLPKWIPPGTESAVHVDLHSKLQHFMQS